MNEFKKEPPLRTSFTLQESQEAYVLLDKHVKRSEWSGDTGITPSGHLGLCSKQVGPAEDCHICGTTIRTINFLNEMDTNHVRGDYAFPIEESERQVILLAIAHLSIRRPGWNYMLSTLALKMDNPDAEGKPMMYEHFKKCHVAALPDEPTPEHIKDSLIPERPPAYPPAK